MAYVAGVGQPRAGGLGVAAAAENRCGWKARYVAGLYDLEEMGPLLAGARPPVGMEVAEVWVALTDGGNGLEEFCRQAARPDLVVILDFYHAASYLEKLTQPLFPHDADQATGQAEQWCRLLERRRRSSDVGGAGERRRAVLLPVGHAEGKEQLETTRGYFTNNVHQMEYPEYQGRRAGRSAAEWWRQARQDGGGQRLKRGGHALSEARRTHALCH